MNVNETVVAAGDETEIEQPVNAEVSTENAETTEKVGESGEPQANANSGEPKPNEEQPKPRPRSGWLRKINDKDEEIARLKTQLGEKSSASEPSRAETDKTDEFDADAFMDGYSKKHPDHSYERAHAAMTAEVTRLETAKALKAGKESEQRAQREKAIEQTFIERVEKAKSVHADFEDVAFEPDLVAEVKSIPNVDAFVSQADAGLEILYHFGTEEGAKELERIAKLPPLGQLKALFALEDKLAPQKSAESTEEKPSAAEVTRAPRPLSNTKPSGAANEIKPGQPGSDKLTDKEWFDKRQEQKRKR